MMTVCPETGDFTQMLLIPSHSQEKLEKTRVESNTDGCDKKLLDFIEKMMMIKK